MRFFHPRSIELSYFVPPPDGSIVTNGDEHATVSAQAEMKKVDAVGRSVCFIFCMRKQNVQNPVDQPSLKLEVLLMSVADGLFSASCLGSDILCKCIKHMFLHKINNFEKMHISRYLAYFSIFR